jgi:hypothetical protein
MSGQFKVLKTAFQPYLSDEDAYQRAFHFPFQED